MTTALLARLLTAVALASAPVAPSGPALHVKASPAVAPCVAAAITEYRRATGQTVSLEIADLGSPASVAGADVVVAADEELNRIIESGTSDPNLDVDVARIPWVLVVPAQADAVDVRSLGRTAATVRTLHGVVAREAWRNLQQQGVAPARVERVRQLRAPIELGPGEIGVVPLSLAGAGQASSLPVPPLTVRALGVRASAHTTAAGRFLTFLTEGAGQTAFRACGRNDAR